MTAEAAAHLEEAGVAVKPYAALLGDVRALAAAGTRIWADPAKVLPKRRQGCCDVLRSMGACSLPLCLPKLILLHASTRSTFRLDCNSRTLLTTQYNCAPHSMIGTSGPCITSRLARRMARETSKETLIYLSS